MELTNMFSVPIHNKNQVQFRITWKGQWYVFTAMSQNYKYLMDFFYSPEGPTSSQHSLEHYRNVSDTTQVGI